MTTANRPVLLIPVSQHFTLRYLVLTGMLDSLAEHFACVLALTWKDDELEREMAARGVHTVSMAQFTPKRGYRFLRNWTISVWEADMKSPTPAIDRRRMRSLARSRRERLYHRLKSARYTAAKLIAAVEPLRRVTESLEDQAFWNEPGCRELSALVERVAPSLILSITPFISSEAVLCRVAQALGVRTIASILSFDNLTSRGKIETVFHHYGVWNATMKAEAIRIYRVRDDQVEITGAPQMDFYAWPGFLSSRQEFFEAHHLDPARPVILFGAGPSHIAPVEPSILVQLDQIVSSYQASVRPQILLRRHPVDDADRWRDALSQCANVIVAEPWSVRDCRAGVIRDADVRALASVLAHTDIHISTSSTMSLDGALFDKPQIGLAYDPAGTRPLSKIMYELYEREHYLALTRSNGIDIVRSREELASALASFLDDPTRNSSARQVMLKNLLGVPFGHATASTVSMILRYAQREEILKTTSKSDPDPKSAWLTTV